MLLNFLTFKRGKKGKDRDCYNNDKPDKHQACCNLGYSLIKVTILGI